MNLRQKTLLLVTFPLLGFIMLLYASLSFVLLRGYARLEEQDTYRNTQRVQEALISELQQLSINSADWAAWDDTYIFIQDQNQAYIDSNLSFDALESLHLNYLLLLDLEGEVVFGRGYDLLKQEDVSVPDLLLQQLSPQKKLLTYDEFAPFHSGLIPLGDQVLLVVSRPILKSDTTGPARGTFFMGRYLDEAKVADLQQRTQLAIAAFPVQSPTLSEEMRQIRDTLQSDWHGSINTLNEAPILIKTLDADFVSGYTLLPDLYGDPLVLLQVTLPRAIYKQGQVSLQYLAFSLLGVGTIFTIAILLLLERIVLKRLTQLNQEVQYVGEGTDFSYRVRPQGDDELSDLAVAINTMLAALEVSNCKLAEEQRKAEHLLLNILPEPIAKQLKQNQASIAQHFDEVTILFADIVDFTPLSSRLSPIELVDVLNQIFSTFDALAEKFGLEKIKTIGDAYMVAAGLPIPRPDHAEAIADMAIAIQDAIETIQTSQGDTFQIRIGINTGVVVAGVIGTKKFIYDLWGDAVNIASRMESSSKPGMIQVTSATYELLYDRYIFEERGAIPVKGRGQMTTYWLKGKRSDPTAEARPPLTDGPLREEEQPVNSTASPI